MWYHITQSPGFADVGRFPTEKRTRGEVLLQYKNIWEWMTLTFYLRKKFFTIALALDSYFSLIVIDLHKVHYKYYLESKTFIVFFLTTSDIWKILKIST